MSPVRARVVLTGRFLRYGRRWSSACSSASQCIPGDIASSPRRRHRGRGVSGRAPRACDQRRLPPGFLPGPRRGPRQKEPGSGPDYSAGSCRRKCLSQCASCNPNHGARVAPLCCSPVTCRSHVLGAGRLFEPDVPRCTLIQHVVWVE